MQQFQRWRERAPRWLAGLGGVLIAVLAATACAAADAESAAAANRVGVAVASALTIAWGSAFYAAWAGRARLLDVITGTGEPVRPVIREMLLNLREHLRVVGAVLMFGPRVLVAAAGSLRGIREVSVRDIVWESMGSLRSAGETSRVTLGLALAKAALVPTLIVAIIRLDSVGMAIAIAFLGSAGVTVVGVLSSKTVSRRLSGLLWTLAALAGVWSFAGKSHVDLVGLIAAGLAAVSTFYTVRLRSRLEELGKADEGMAYAMLWAAVLVALPVLFIPGQSWFNGHVIGATIMAGGFTGLETALEVLACKLISEEVFGLAGGVEPAAGLVVGHLVLGQRMDGWPGVLAVVVAALGAALTLNRKARNQQTLK